MGSFKKKEDARRGITSSRNLGLFDILFISLCLLGTLLWRVVVVIAILSVLFIVFQLLEDNMKKSFNEKLEMNITQIMKQNKCISDNPEDPEYTHESQKSFR